MTFDGNAGSTPSDLESYQVLRSRATSRLGSFPADKVAEHVLRVTAEADWPVRRAALDALIRRWSFARRDDLAVAVRPRARSGLGMYQTRRSGDSKRPYRTLLAAVDPIVGSCNCKDYQNASLGLCKHMLVALDDLMGKPERWDRAAAHGLDLAMRGPRLVWEPVRPYTGYGDWLDRIVWLSGDTERPPSVVRKWFARGADGVWKLAGDAPNDPAVRMSLVEGLLRHVRRESGSTTVFPHDPVLEPLLEEDHRRLKRLVDGTARAADMDEALRSLKHPLYPYQHEGTARFLSAGRLLLADDMGLGKTVQAIAACHILWQRGDVKKGLLIVPASLKSQWLREWQSFSEAPVAVVDGSPNQRKDMYQRHEQGFLIANYEQVLRDLPLMHAWAPGIIVLDEAQRIKNWATKTASYVKLLHPTYRLVLTGTPMENRLDELASVMDWVDERAMEPKWRLSPWHATLCDGTREVAGARNLDTLRTRLAPSLVRRVRREVLEQLPSRTDTRIPVEMTPAQGAEHDDLRRPISSLLRKAKKRPLTHAEFLRLMQLLTTQRILCNGLAQHQFEEIWPALQTTKPSETVLRGLDAPKLIEMREIVQRIVVEGGHKMVVFSQWRRMLQLVRWATSDLLADAGLRSAFFSGDESQKRRTQNVIEFHDDPTLAMLLATDAGGVGLNLQRAASYVLNLELPWNPAVLEQRIGRVYRLGQKQPVQVYNLVTESGIEARIAALVSNKQALFTGLFDGDSNEVEFTGAGTFIEKLEKLVETVKVPDLSESEEVVELPDDTDEDPVPAPMSAGRRLSAGESKDATPAPNDMDEATAAPSSTAPEPSRPTPTSERDEPQASSSAAATVSTTPASKEPGSATPGSAKPASEEPGSAPSPATASQRSSPPSASSVQDMFAGIHVEHTNQGGLRIEAAPEAAGALAAMFQGMAVLLNEAARGSVPKE